MGGCIHYLSTGQIVFSLSNKWQDIQTYIQTKTSNTFFLKDGFWFLVVLIMLMYVPSGLFLNGFTLGTLASSCSHKDRVLKLTANFKMSPGVYVSGYSSTVYTVCQL